LCGCGAVLEKSMLAIIKEMIFMEEGGNCLQDDSLKDP
jgi:hypothetical protein